MATELLVVSARAVAIRERRQPGVRIAVDRDFGADRDDLFASRDAIERSSPYEPSPTIEDPHAEK